MQDGDADVAGGVDYVFVGVFSVGIWFFLLLLFVFSVRKREGREEGGGGLGRGGGGGWFICTVPFGWKMGVWKVILGGRWGYSGGKMRWAR